MSAIAQAYEPWPTDDFVLDHMRAINDHIEEDLRYTREYDEKQATKERRATQHHSRAALLLLCAVFLIENSWEHKSTAGTPAALAQRVTFEHRGVQIIADEGKCAATISRGMCATLDLVPTDLPEDPTLKIVNVTPWTPTSSNSVERRERLEFINGSANVTWRVASEHLIE